MDNEKFKAILLGVGNACNKAIHNSAKNMMPFILESATKIYIEEMARQSTEHHDKQEESK